MFILTEWVLEVLIAFIIPSVTASVTPFRIQDVDLVGINPVKVPVVLGVQSRDRNALLCQTIFDRVLKRVAHEMDLSLAYIADIDTSNEVFGVSCDNGFPECAANVQQLCIHKHADFDGWWQFVMCQSYQGLDRIGEADVAIMCARSASIDWDKSGAAECIGSEGSGTGKEGVELLQQNVKATNAAHINTSCSVVINNKTVCIHDGSWKQCEDGHTAHEFARQIHNEWNKINGQSVDLFFDDEI